MAHARCGADPTRNSRPLSIDILEGKVREGQTVYVDVKSGKLEFKGK
jgi:hypothetical protein